MLAESPKSMTPCVRKLEVQFDETRLLAVYLNEILTP